MKMEIACPFCKCVPELMMKVTEENIESGVPSVWLCPYCEKVSIYDEQHFRGGSRSIELILVDDEVKVFTTKHFGVRLEIMIARRQLATVMSRGNCERQQWMSYEASRELVATLSVGKEITITCYSEKPWTIVHSNYGQLASGAHSLIGTLEKSMLQSASWLATKFNMRRLT